MAWCGREFKSLAPHMLQGQGWQLHPQDTPAPLSHEAWRELHIWATWSPGSPLNVASPGHPLLPLTTQAPVSSVPTNYKVWFQVEDALQSREGVPCCHCPIPAHARSASVSLEGVSSLDPITNLSLSCLGKGRASLGKGLGKASDWSLRLLLPPL